MWTHREIEYHCHGPESLCDFVHVSMTLLTLVSKQHTVTAVRGVAKHQNGESVDGQRRHRAAEIETHVVQHTHLAIALLRTIQRLRSHMQLHTRTQIAAQSRERAR